MNRLRTGLCGLSLALVAGGCVDITQDAKASDTPSPAEARAELDERLANRAELIAEIGPACMEALAPYRHYAEFGELDDDSVVRDLMRRPDRPCGDVPAVIREDRQALAYHDVAVAFAEASVEQAG